MSFDTFVREPLFGIAVTVGFYTMAGVLQRKWGWLHPLLVTAGGIMLLLAAARIPYSSYRVGGDVISFFLGPATVALGVPLYKQAIRIRRNLLPIISGIAAGAISGMLSAAAVAWSLGASRTVILTLLPKSVTTAISVEIVRGLGGNPELGAVFTTLTGLFGAMVGPAFLRWCGIHSDLPIGAAIGTASHGIGTARVLQDSELQGSVSGFALGVAGIMVSIMMIPVYGWLR